MENLKKIWIQSYRNDVYDFTHIAISLPNLQPIFVPGITIRK